MKNYTLLCRYARRFTGEALAKDLVHNLWLRKHESGVDILSENLSNRMMFVMIKHEFLNSFNKKNQQVHVLGKEFNQDREIEGKQQLKEANQLSKVQEYDPSVFLHYHEIDTIVLEHIQHIIDSFANSDPRAGNAVKYAPETIMKVYELVKQDCSVKEMSELLEVGEQSIRNYKKKIVEICGFLKPNEGRKR